MKFVKMFIAWVAMICCIGSLIFIHFLPPIVAALIAFIGLSILVAMVIYLLNEM